MVYQWITWRVDCVSHSIVIQVKLRNDHDDGYIRAGQDLTYVITGHLPCKNKIIFSQVAGECDGSLFDLIPLLHGIEHFACVTQKIQTVRFSS